MFFFPIGNRLAKCWNTKWIERGRKLSANCHEFKCVMTKNWKYFFGAWVWVMKSFLSSKVHSLAVFFPNWAHSVYMCCAISACILVALACSMRVFIPDVLLQWRTASLNFSLSRKRSEHEVKHGKKHMLTGTLFLRDYQPRGVMQREKIRIIKYVCRFADRRFFYKLYCVTCVLFYLQIV
jgi:hypothetical protein